MRAFVITAPRTAEVIEVDEPAALPGEAVVAVERAGVCGTDADFFTGDMQLLHTGGAEYPMRIGHEWMGRVAAVGDGVDARWVGRRVTGDTMLGCGACRRCRRGLQHVCEHREELGVRGRRPGALAEKVAVPAGSLHPLPDTVDDVLGALVEPGSNAYRAVKAAQVGEGDRLLVLGPGAIGLMAGLFARAQGVEVHLLGRSSRSLDVARTMGFENVWTEETLPELPFDGVVNTASTSEPAVRAVQLIEPGRRIVYLGLSGEPSLIDVRDLTLRDVTAVGVLSGSPVARQTIDAFGSGAVDPRPLVAATVPLEGLAAVLAGERPDGAGPGPKFHVDPRLLP